MRERSKVIGPEPLGSTDGLLMYGWRKPGVETRAASAD
ncbi:MAG: hypothetical protein JWS10_2589 [Cypionkella sp.]|nr:hypothetical protein [Cypionkella sp.]